MSTSKNTFIPKSLHTISALANVAAYLMQKEHLTPVEAIDRAGIILGQMGKSDLYGLQASALKTITKDAAPVSGLAGKCAVAFMA